MKTERSLKNMKCYVITISDLERSVRAAQRCIKSGENLLHSKIEIFPAITPKDDPEKIFHDKGFHDEYFVDVYSRKLNCMAAFLSHLSLWEMCAKDNEEYIIFEHDAVILDQIPKHMNYKKCVSLGAPSYGVFNTPETLGVIPLTSKPYFPGAHAYRLKPSAAKIFVQHAKLTACPTDLYLDIRRFPWLQEYYPWPVIAKDNFTTIQLEGGCVAKHNWKNGLAYEILNHA